MPYGDGFSGSGTIPFFLPSKNRRSSSVRVLASIHLIATARSWRNQPSMGDHCARWRSLGSAISNVGVSLLA